MSGAAAALLSGGGMNPITRTYTTGTAATETVPTGATMVQITLDGAGGSGGRDSGGNPGGGGGSGRCILSILVVGGNTMTYTVPTATAGVGVDGFGNTGAAGTVTGTVSGGSISMTANGGAGGGIGTSGAGGTSTGGSTNATGSVGGFPDGGTAASGAESGASPGSGGAGRQSATSFVGAVGRVTFYYT